MSFQYCPMFDYSQNTSATIIYDDNLLASIIPDNMMIKQEEIATDNLLLATGYFPQMHQDIALPGYPSSLSDDYNSLSSNRCRSMSSTSSPVDLTYLTTTTATAPSTAFTHTSAATASAATASATCTSSPSSHCSHDSFFSPSESLAGFDFFPTNTPYNEPTLYEYWSANSSPAPANQPVEALYFEQTSNAAMIPSGASFLSSSWSTSSLSSSSSPSSSLPSSPLSSTYTLYTKKKTAAGTTIKPKIEGRPYSCPSCPRAFARKHDLQRHIRVHTGDKPYMCPCCKKTFARTDALKRHLRMEDQCRQSEQVQAMKETGRRRYRNL